jgi:hypothetical protein
MTRRAVRCSAAAIALTVLFAFAVTGPVAPVRGQGFQSTLIFLPAGPTTGLFARTTQTGDVEFWGEESRRTTLEFTLFGLTPHGVHSVFLDLDPARAPLSGVAPDCVATDPATGTRADVYCWTPAAPDNAAYTSGVGLDPHGFVADERGNAQFRLQLNYDIRAPQSAPLVLRLGVTQTVGVAPASGMCTGSRDANFVSRIDSVFMRAFDTATAAVHPARSPSFPLLQAPAQVRLVRATVRGFFILEHLDGVTHGRVIGQGVAGPGDGPCGDHVRRLRGDLSAARERLR